MPTNETNLESCDARASSLSRPDSVLLPKVHVNETSLKTWILAKVMLAFWGLLFKMCRPWASSNFVGPRASAFLPPPSTKLCNNVPQTSPALYRSLKMYQYLCLHVCWLSIYYTRNTFAHPYADLAGQRLVDDVFNPANRGLDPLSECNSSWVPREFLVKYMCRTGPLGRIFRISTPSI